MPVLVNPHRFAVFGAAPVVVSRTDTISNVAGLTHAVAIPTHAAGDHLLLEASTGATTFDSVADTAEGDAWVPVTDDPGAPNLSVYRCVVATGGAAANVTVTIGASQKATFAVYRITGAHSTLPEVASATGSDTTPDPPSLAPSWGAANTLWVVAEANNIPAGAAGFPSGYTDTFSLVNSVGLPRTCLAGGYKTAIAGSEDPGAYTITVTGPWRATTIAVRPAA